MKISLKNYYKPTPKKWRKFGDALLAVSTIAATIAVQCNIHLGAEIALYAGVIGKFLTNFFSEENNN